MANNWWLVKSFRLRAEVYAGRVSFASRNAS